MVIANQGYVSDAGLQRMLERLKRHLDRIVDPLRADEEIEHFTLSMPETHTTTIDGDVGWSNRPPAVLKCPKCSGEIYQHRSTTAIDCPDCWFEGADEEFAELELVNLVCPNCRRPMQDGQRHPRVFDVPEWATCDHCRYHWEYAHPF